MAYNFPNSPSNGDTVTISGIVYTYNSTKGAWKTTAASGGGGGGGASVTTDDTAPSNPSDGDLWWDSDGGKMYVYYDDGASSQWVSVSVPGATGSTGPAGAAGADGADGADGSAQSYTNLAAFPSTGNTLGDLAVAQDTKAMYMWDGTEWDRVSSGSDESPIITTEPATSHELNSDGTTSTVTMVAEDPEGFDIEYGIRYNTSGNTLPTQLASATTINQSTGVYTFTPSTSTSNVGSFNARLTASDGNRVTTRTVPIELVFGYQYFRLYITAKRGSDLDLQLGEIELTDENGVVSYSGASSNQGAMIDSNLSTKAWQRITPTTSNPAIWTITLASPITLVSYRMGTADDHSARDPWNWEIQASYDNSTWTTLHTVTAGGGQLPSSRQTWSAAYIL